MTYSTFEIWLIIVLLGLGTYAIRFSFLGLIGDRKMPDWLLRHLRYTPVAVLPGLVAPLVAWLCHEALETSGEIFSVGGGRAARVTTVVYPGLKEAEPTPESIRDAWATVMSGGKPVEAGDGSVDAMLMDEGFAAIAGASLARDD